MPSKRWESVKFFHSRVEIRSNIHQSRTHGTIQGSSSSVAKQIVAVNDKRIVIINSNVAAKVVHERIIVTKKGSSSKGSTTMKTYSKGSITTM